MMKNKKEFIEKMGLIIIITSIVGGATMDFETVLLHVIGVISMAFTFIIGIWFYIFTDSVLVMQSKSMKRKNPEKR